MRLFGSFFSGLIGVALLAIDRMFAFVASVFAGDSHFALTGGDIGSLPPHMGRSLDRSLINGMRHEANVSRRSADRHI